jgi:hypothetical protein
MEDIGRALGGGQRDGRANGRWKDMPMVDGHQGAARSTRRTADVDGASGARCFVGTPWTNELAWRSKSAADDGPNEPYFQYVVRAPADSLAAAAGTKFRMTLALPVGAVMNCADNSGAKSELSIRASWEYYLARRMSRAGKRRADEQAASRQARGGSETIGRAERPDAHLDEAAWTE